MHDSADHIEIQVTCTGSDEAAEIARILVERRLAACVQQLPIASTFRWHGAIECSDEILLLIKTTRARYSDVEATVLAHHSYDVPAVTAVPIVAGSADYLEWIDTETA
jgi:periplasmic divalent cation tolerance protein